MPNEDLSKRHFQKKISTYCDVRIVPVAPDWVVDNLRAYLLALIAFRTTPALANNRYDWRQIARDCGIDEALTTALKKQLRPALDAIMRWLKEPPVEDDAKKGKRPQARPKARATNKFAPSPMDQHHGVEEVGSSRLTGRPGPKPRRVSDKPEPLFEANEDPSSFKDALAYQMRRFGESYWQLHRAVVRIDESFDAKTLLSWIEGQRVPRSVASFDILGRIERRYGLPNGYFKAKLPHQSRSLYGHDLEDISPAERRRLAWHLPDDFGSLPFSKREEILEWVRRVIISGSTDYRRFQAAATKQRYAIRFPGITYGGSALTPRPAASSWLRDEDKKGCSTEAFEDPDLLSGVVDAPPRLAMEMADLIRFKTSTLTEIGFRRNGVWNEETASQKIEHLGLMFGALAASPNGVVKGRGVPLNQLTFGLLIFPGVWDWYLQWRERRRGFFTKWEDDMLMVAMALTRAEVGWIRQHPELLRNVKPIEGLLTTDEIESARRD